MAALSEEKTTNEVERFGKYGPNINVSNGHKTITKSTYIGSQTAYGQQIIVADNTNNNIYEWIIKIEKKGVAGLAGYGICIGIDEAKCKWTKQGFFGKGNTINYSYHSAGYMHPSGKPSIKGYDQYKSNDKIKVQLNMRQSILTFYKNDIQQRYTFNVTKSDDLQYRLAVSLCGVLGADSVTLLHFNIISPTNDVIDDNKQIPQTSKIDASSLENLVSQLKTENTALKNKIQDLENEKKETELALDTAYKEIERLKLKTLDTKTKTFVEWDSNQVHHWMMGIDNGILKQYHDVLKQKILNSQIKGTDLLNMDMNDIEHLGISIFAHRKSLQRNIKMLTKNSDYDQHVNDHNDNEMEGTTP